MDLEDKRKRLQVLQQSRPTAVKLTVDNAPRPARITVSGAAPNLAPMNERIGRAGKQPTIAQQIVSAPGKLVNALWQGVQEAPRVAGTGISLAGKQGEATRASQLRLQEQTTQSILNAQRKLKDPTIAPAEKARWANYLNALQPEAVQRDVATRQELEQTVKDLSPKKQLAAYASMGFDVATAGVGVGTAQAIKQAGANTAKQVAKVVAKQAAKGATVAAPSGAFGEVVTNGDEATVGGAVKGAATSAVVGGSLPLVGYGLSRLGSKVLSRITNSSNADEIATILKKEATALSDEEAQGVATIIANESDPQTVQTILKSVDEAAPDTVPRGARGAVEVDSLTDAKIGSLIDKASGTPRPTGTTRLFQVLGKNGESNYFFDNIDDLAFRQNNITSRSDKFKFVDVPENSVVDVPGKPGVKALKEQLDQAIPEAPAPTPTEALEQAVEQTPPNANISQTTPTTATPEGTPSVSADIAQGDAGNLADTIAQRAQDTKNLYAPKTKLQKAKEIWEPRAVAIQLDKKFAKSIGEKLRNLKKTESLEALIERSGQAKEIAAEYLKNSNIATTIQKYGRGSTGEIEFNTYRLFMRDLEQRADGRPTLFRDISPEDMQKWVTEYEARNPEARQDLINIVNDIKAVQDMSVYSDSPFVSAEELLAARTKKDGSQYQFYTPAQRAMPEETASANIATQNVGTLGQQKVLQEMTGSDIPLDPSFDALTDYTETVFKQLGQAKVVQKYAERVQQGVVDGAKFIQTGDETARIAQIKKSISELRDVQQSLIKEKGKVRFGVRQAGKELKLSTKEVSNRVREILRQTVDDPDASTAIASMSDQDLQEVMDILVTPDIKKTPNIQRIYDRFVKKSEAHANVAQKLEDIKMDIESVANAKKGLGRELVDLRPDPITGRQTILGIDQNGNKFRIEVPPEHAELLQGLGKEKMNSVLRLIRTLQQPIRESLTGILNPSFQIAQATFNTMMLPIISDQGIRTLGPRAVTAAIKSFNANDEFQRVLRKNGAIRYGGNLDKLVTDTTADALASQADALSKMKWYANPKRGWEKLSLLGGKLDQAARTAAAQAAKDDALRKGMTMEEALAEAGYAYNNVLPNFSNLSNEVKTIDVGAMYAGAGQAGTRTIMRAFSRNPVKVSARFAVAGTALTSVAAYNMSQDQGEAFYKDMQDSGKNYVLDNNIVIVLPGARKDPKTGEWTGIVKIPISPELRPINASIQRTIFSNDSGAPVKQYATSLFDFVTGQARTTSNPLIQLGTGIATGKDPRTGRDIYDETMTPEEKREAIKNYVGRGFGLAGQATTGDKGLTVFTDSFIDKIYGAKGLSEGGKYYKNEKDVLDQLQLSRNEKDAYTSVVAPRSKDLAGNTIKERTYYDSSARAEVWLKYPKTFEASRLMDAKNRAQGKPGDPIFDLPPDQLKIILSMQANFSPGNKEDKAITELNPWIKDFNKKRSEFFDQIQSNMTPEQRAQMGVDPMGLKIPKATPDVQAKIDQAAQLTNSAAKAQFYRDNPEVSDYFAEQNNYQRAKRSFLGLPQFDNYPTPTPEIQAIMDEYNALPKGNGPIGKTTGKPTSPARSAWIKANPDKWAQMNEQWSRQDIYRLQEEGALAVYEGLDFTEQGIKSIQDLAKALGVSSGSYGSNGYGSGKSGGSAAKDYMSIMKLLSGIDTTLPKAPTINQKPSAPKLRFRQPFTGAKPKLRVQLKS